MDKYIGTLLDNRYEIMELIGSGGMAQVYKARCNRLNRLVAIKILKEDLSNDGEFRRRFHAESQAVAMLSHPNIVSVYDVSHSDNIDYIVMELIEGITLKQYMEQKGQLNWREALHFATQIAKGLEHAHSRGIIHRDIKPHNIMILKDGSVKVADFGIAQVSSSQNTLTREALGSVHYISPEQAKGAHVDERTDIYSLGVVMYEMLAGRPPFDGDTPVSVAIQHINATPKSIHLLNPGVPLGLEQISMHAMASNLDERYASATEMLTDLEEFRKNPSMFLPDYSRNAQAAQSDADALSDRILSHSAAERAVSKATGSRPQTRKKKRAEHTAPQPTETERKKNRTAALIGAVCIVLAFLGICFFLYRILFSDLFTKTAEDQVPNVIGKYIENVNESQYPNFKFEVKYWQTSSEYDYGYILDQNPAAGRDAKVGSTIELTVCSGTDDKLMPNLVNLTLQNAKSCLSTMSVNVVVDVDYEESDVYTDGYIIRTEPGYDQPLTDGQKVTLIVSQGSTTKLVPVPAMVGMDVDEALALIDEAELNRGSVLTVSSDLPAGTVTFQSVEPDENVKVGTVINLQVSRGKGEISKPTIVQQSGDQTVSVGTTVNLSVNAISEDDGVLSYAWYQSSGGNKKGSLVSGDTSDSTFTFTPKRAGTYYFYCQVESTYQEASASTVSAPISVTVTDTDAVEKNRVINVTLPVTKPSYQITVYVGGELNTDPFAVNLSDVQGSTISISVHGKGTQNVEVYADETCVFSQEINFDTAG